MEIKVGDILIHNKGYCSRLKENEQYTVEKIKMITNVVKVKDKDGVLFKFLLEDIDRFFSKM